MLREHHNWAEHAAFHAQAQKRVAVVIIGGTLLSVPDPERGMRPAITGREVLKYTPKLRLLGKRLKLNIVPLMMRDSADMIHEDWTEITETVAALSQSHHGIVLIHGTDTAQKTGTAVSFGLQAESALQNRPNYLSAPVSIGSSQLPLPEFQSDAELQVQDAVMSVIKASDEGVSEVIIPAGHAQLLRASRTGKFTERGFHIHGSANYPAIGSITTAGTEFTRYAERIDYIRQMLRESTRPLVQSKFMGGVESIALNGLGKAGPKIAMLEHDDCTGLVIYSLGAGNGPFTREAYAITPVISRAREIGKPVIITTSIQGGQVDSETYEAGRVLLDAGGIPSGDMTPEAAEIKLAWAMAHPRYRSEGRAFLEEIFLKNLVGELGNPDLHQSK